VTPKLKFQSQTATNKANRALGLIKKSFNALNRKTLPMQLLVRPYLCCWEPTDGKSTKRAIRCVQDLSMTNICLSLRLPRHYQRHHADIITVLSCIGMSI